MTRVLITGAGGFTGRYLATELRRAGYEPHGLVRNATALEDYMGIHVGDLTDIAALQRVIEQVRPAYVVHLAAVSFVGHGDIDEIYTINLLGTRHVLEALTRAKLPLAAVLLASSANIYGNIANEEPIPETLCPAPANDYAVSKLAMEQMAWLYRDRLPLIVVRPFNYTGVGQSLSFLLPKIVDHFRRRAPIIELGNLDIARDFSDVRWVVQIYRKLLETPTTVGDTFNVCSGKAYTLQEILQMACEISGHAIEVRVNPAFVRANEVKRLLGSRSKLEGAIGLIEDIPLRDTLRWMLGDAL
jgi:nucleoside-diphosphate-sugar epimerase